MRRPDIASDQPYEVKYAFANPAASATDTALVTAVTGKRIRVLSYGLGAAGAATPVTFNSKPAGAGTAVSAGFTSTNPNPGYSPVGYFQTAVGEGLSVTTGAGSITGVQVTYVEV